MTKSFACIEDLRLEARRRVPRVFFDYVESGSYSEQTLSANTRALREIELRQRVLVDVEARSTQCTILGQRYSSPIVLAPTGLCGMVHGDGEILSQKAAEDAGMPFCLSTMSICSIEDVAEAANKPFWFQLYMMRDRNYCAKLIERAEKADCDVLVLTVDLQVQGQRHKDFHNGLSVPPKPSVSTLLDVLRHPGWALGVLKGKRRTFGNLAEALANSSNVVSLSKWIAEQFDPTLDWDDVAWVRQHWPGKLVIKGILDPEDAERAVMAGADAIVVSNHGGRQLDGTGASISRLPAIANAVGQNAQVLFDGGIRSGQDIFKALAAGADACMVGRAYLYGLGAAGQSGVRRAIEILTSELDVTMALTGHIDVGHIDETALLKWPENKSLVPGLEPRLGPQRRATARSV